MKKLQYLFLSLFVGLIFFGFSQKTPQAIVPIGKYAITPPRGFSNPQWDTTFLETNYGKARFIAFVSQHKKAACMAGIQEYSDAAFIGVNEGDALDSLQQQLIRNMSGKVYRQFKVKKNGKLTRTTFFTAFAQDSTNTYWRFELMIDAPNVYQIAFTSTEKNRLTSKETDNYFKSLTIKK